MTLEFDRAPALAPVPGTTGFEFASLSFRIRRYPTNRIALFSMAA